MQYSTKILDVEKLKLKDTGKQTDRQTDRNREADSERDRQTDRHRQTDWKSQRQKGQSSAIWLTWDGDKLRRSFHFTEDFLVYHLEMREEPSERLWGEIPCSSRQNMVSWQQDRRFDAQQSNWEEMRSYPVLGQKILHEKKMMGKDAVSDFPFHQNLRQKKG